MNKEDLLKQLAIKLQSGEIKKDEVLSLINFSNPLSIKTSSDQASTAINKKNILKTDISITKILYAIGAGIVFIGLAIFVAQIWDDLNSFFRIAVTLGSGLLLSATGSILLLSKPKDNLGSIFLLLGGIFISMGAAVFLYELGIESADEWPATLTAGVLFIFYLILYFILKKSVLVLFAIAHATAFIYLFTASITKSLDYLLVDDIFIYLTMFVGISYVMIAYLFRKIWNTTLISLLYLTGGIGFFGSTFALMMDFFLWQIFYIGFVIIGIVFSIYIKNKSILAISMLALIAYLTYITSEYFADSIGWPISLIVLGFVILGLGFMSIEMNKKYLKTPNPELPQGNNMQTPEK